MLQNMATLGQNRLTGTHCIWSFLFADRGGITRQKNESDDVETDQECGVSAGKRELVRCEQDGGGAHGREPVAEHEPTQQIPEQVRIRCSRFHGEIEGFQAEQPRIAVAVR